MTDRSSIELIVGRVVGEVLESHAVQLRSEIVRGVMQEVAGGSSLAGGGSCGSSDLARAVAEIQLGTSQREILRAFLDAGSRYAARIALFVVKGSHATGWQGRGFTSNDRLKDFALDGSAAAVARAIGRRGSDSLVSIATVGEQDPRFLEEIGTPASKEGRFFSLMLKDKVAALVYADGGTELEGVFDAGALELLVLATSAWLEVNSLRKQAHKETAATPAEGRDFPAPSQPTQRIEAGMNAAAAGHDPFAAHTPVYAVGRNVVEQSMAAAAGTASSTATVAAEQAMTSTTEVQSAVEEVVAEPPELHPISQAEFETAPALKSSVETAAAPAEATPLSVEDQDIHRKAQRFARLLVDEVKLYNQAKVTEGRRNRDLYDRLQEVIEKSRVMYQKRYGSTVAASANYFGHEIIRSLAEDDASVMGPHFQL